jgi:broad specificity phosphatase PhoE
MIRHAESMNNQVYSSARHLYKAGTPDFDSHGWMNYVETNRTADPTISQKAGIHQAQKLSDFLVQHLMNQASEEEDGVHIITSPMQRTIQTILPTLKRLPPSKVKLVVNGFYHESEGCHVKNVPQSGMNQFDIQNIVNHPNNEHQQQGDNYGHEPEFIGFSKDPNLGWYNHGLGPETRSESEIRAAAFYTWLCEYLDEQLYQSKQNPTNHPDVYDAGVRLPDESHEVDHDKIEIKNRKRRTALLIGHGDFMSLCLKRITSGFGHYVENFGVPHRTAFTHFNTGITELEYFGKGKYEKEEYFVSSFININNNIWTKNINVCAFIIFAGRFLIMHTNDTPHLHKVKDSHLFTGGSLKDGWAYLMPQDKILLYQEVASAFNDELDEYVKEQTMALRNLYLERRGGSFLMRYDDDDKDKDDDKGVIKDDEKSEVDDRDKEASKDDEMTFFIQRGLQVVACVTYNNESNMMKDMVVRPSAKKNGNLQQELVDAVVNHVKKEGKAEVVIESGNDENCMPVFYSDLGFNVDDTGEKIKLVL